MNVRRCRPLHRTGLAIVAFLACTPEPAAAPAPAPTPADPVSELEREYITDWAPGQFQLFPRVPITELVREKQVGSILYTAQVEFVGNPRRGTLGPPERLIARLSATNTGRRLAHVITTGCAPVRVFAYPRSDHSAGPTWDSHAPCDRPLVDIEIPAKTTHTSEIARPAGDVLAALGQGRHEFVISLPEDAGSLDAGALTYDAGLADLRYRTTTTLEAGTTLAFAISVRNDGTRPVHLVLGPCGPRMRAFSHGGRAEPAVFRSDDIDQDCPDTRVTAELAPGATLTPADQPALALRIPVAHVLADGLPSARYYFTLQLVANHIPVDLLAGEAVLVRPPA